MREPRAVSTAASICVRLSLSVRKICGAKKAHVASPVAVRVLSAPNESPLAISCLTIERV